jgi:hydrogenase expression/formation protein HypD
MKYIEEYRNAELALKLSESIKKITTRNWTLMEICGGQTHTIVKYSLEELLPDKIRLVHGPGCPVCVTPIEMVNKAIAIASRDNVIFCSFGDMLRVPGSEKDLLSVKANGGNVRTVYSPIDALSIAEKNPDKEVVFFAVGFETTAPGNAMSVYQAKKKNIRNFSILVSHVLVPPAMEAILSSKNNQVQGFLAAGHVCAIMGYEEYFPIAAKYKVPIVVTGFEPIDLLQGIHMCVKQLEEGRYEPENQYIRTVNKEGNKEAQRIIREVFEITSRKWRGIGEIQESGLCLRKEFKQYDAELKFDIAHIREDESTECIAGLVLQGIKRPSECSAFRTLCNPEKPLGAPMVSPEGACSAYFKYKVIESKIKENG